MTHVLAGDIGGTRARFAVFDVSKAPRLVHQEVLPSASFKTFDAVLKAFSKSAAREVTGGLRISAATFGVAGPVVAQRVKTTNLPWTIDAASVSRAFAIPSVTLLNDLVAAGLGAMASPPSKLAIVHGGRPKAAGGNVAVIAAGTGLGEASFIWDGAEHIACATEGSHVDFAPRNEVEDALLASLRKELRGRVSYERVASGSTIARVYDFFVRERGVKETKLAGAFLASAEDRNAAVVELAESGQSEAAMRAVDLWASVYGAEAGNLALKCLSTAGVYVCGGVSARLALILAQGLPGRKKKGPSPFVEAFLDKGRMRPLVEAIPVAVCLEPHAGLFGAVTHAASTAAVAPAKRPPAPRRGQARR
ncbi:MAG: glucokinase [Labilithrix sp.]|nr:glucokinase [Labilithrix sp.]